VDFPTAIEKYWTHVALSVGGGVGLWRWWVERRDKRRLEVEAARVARAAAKLDIDRLARDLIDDAVEILRAEVKRLGDELNDIKAEMRQQQNDHIQMIAGKDAELAVARGQIRQLEARCDIYRRLLLDHEIPVPPTFDAQQVRQDGNLKTMGASE
jgi:hypothetical protein